MAWMCCEMYNTIKTADTQSVMTHLHIEIFICKTPRSWFCGATGLEPPDGGPIP